MPVKSYISVWNSSFAEKKVHIYELAFCKLTIKLYICYIRMNKLWNKNPPSRDLSHNSATHLRATYFCLKAAGQDIFIESRPLRALQTPSGRSKFKEALQALREKTHSIPTGQGNELCPEVNHPQIPSHWEKKQREQQHPVTTNPKIRCFSSLLRPAVGLTR